MYIRLPYLGRLSCVFWQSLLGEGEQVILEASPLRPCPGFARRWRQKLHKFVPWYLYNLYEQPKLCKQEERMINIQPRSVGHRKPSQKAAVAQLWGGTGILQALGHTYICVHASVYVHTHVYIHVHVYAHGSTHIHIYMYIHAYTSTYT